MSDSDGAIYDADGIDREKLAYVMDLKNNRRGRIKEYADKYKKAIYSATDRKLDHNWLWAIKADCAFPSATQNEINAKDAANLIKNGVQGCQRRRQHAEHPRSHQDCSSTPKSSTDRPRLPMPAALPPLDWKCRRTACVSPGLAKKSMIVCTRS